MEEELFRTGIQELFQSIRFVLSLDSRNSETLIFTQVRKLLGFRMFRPFDGGKLASDVRLCPMIL